MFRIFTYFLHIQGLRAPRPSSKYNPLPFSKCLTALRRMYGSATYDIWNAVWTRVGIPMLPIVAWRNIEFITAANMLN